MIENLYLIIMKNKEIKQENITLETVFTYFHMIEKTYECNKEVNFKYSVQDYNFNIITNINNALNIILNCEIPKVRATHNTAIYERGKPRVITPIDIYDRVIQKVLCDYCLIPSIYNHLIYDNGASVKGKGTIFARKRMDSFIEKAKKMYGRDNIYILCFDFKSYFDSIPHKICLKVLQKYVKDERLVNLTIRIIESYKEKDILKIEDPVEREMALKRLYNHEDVGLCLGSQISQVMAVAVLNEFDHYIKDNKRMKFYNRHMDDGRIIHNSKEELQQLLNELKVVIEEMGLKFNEKKTHITKITKGFTFLKIQYRIDKKNRTVKKLVRQGITRERRKLNKFTKKVEQKEMTLDDVYANVQSWNAHSKIANSYRTVRRIMNQYNKLFGGYRMTYYYYKTHPEIKRKKKVVRC